VLKIGHLSTIAQVFRAISSQIRHVLTIGKNLLNSNASSTCPHNMVYFSPLTADIGSGVWDTPANLNGFRMALYSSGRQPNFAALNRGCHLYSAGRPSRSALAYILVTLVFVHFTALCIHMCTRRPHVRLFVCPTVTCSGMLY